MDSVATPNQRLSRHSGRIDNPGPIAWTPERELDVHQWAAAGKRIGVVGRCIQWLLGDWIAYGNSKFGERYARASQITGYDPQTLMNMVYVASRFPISRRREQLSWSHHEALAALEQSEQERWLDDAATHRWSVSDLRTMLRTSRREALVTASTGDAPAHGAVGDEAGREGADEAPAPSGTAARTDRHREPAATAPVVRCPRCGEEISLLGVSFNARGHGPQAAP